MFKIRIADVTVEIDNRYNYVYEKCRDYLTSDGEPAFRVAVSDAEVRTFLQEDRRPMTPPEAESHLVYRHICGRMPRYGAFCNRWNGEWLRRF